MIVVPTPRIFPSAIFSRFYLILDDSWASRCSLLVVLQQASEAGVKLVQYRNKTGSMKQAYEAGLAIRNVAAERDMTFIVNDRCDLALALEADGVHLGQNDLPPLLARKIVGQKMMIGVSTHNSEQVRLATAEGADYLGFGPIFSTRTKANHEPVVGIQGLTDVRHLTTLPIIAIGGIVPGSVPALQGAGANGVAAASAILNAVDRPRVLEQFMAYFQ
ncbi:MAG: thiamine phosphate synthase [Nitrospirales bacterium]|nr:thiamine phosphate synthase [Nitrospira sp.]MDR4459604.1 thiamine phosphate synthase [Nitrospirales bacterium]